MKNPKELCSIVRRNGTFAIKNELSKPYFEDGEEPLKFYSDFSRFPIVIINEQRIPSTGNIPVEDIPWLIKVSEFAMQKELDYKYISKTNNVSSPHSPAFTIRFPCGAMKGKTPVEILLENPEDGEAMLTKQYRWLKANLEQHPDNQKQMDAISEAAKLSKEGKLKEISVSFSSSLPPIELYHTGFRPLIRKKREKDGYCPVYEIHIEWIIGNDYPVSITIENYYAPFSQDEIGLINVFAKQKTDIVKNSMKLQASEWEYILYMIENNMRTFENNVSHLCYKVALEDDLKNREMAGIKS